MKSNATKTICQFLITVFLTTILIMGVRVSMNGMYLIGIPEIETLQKVSISYPAITSEPKEFSDAQQIELAVKLTGFLKYSLWDKADDNEEPLMTITYFLDNGKTLSVSASREIVWWKGKAHPLKEEEIFIRLTESLFFSEDINAE